MRPLARQRPADWLPPTVWVGGAVLKPPRNERSDGPAYSGTLHIEGDTLPVELWWIRDGAGHECLAFSRTSTATGVLWPARDKRNPSAADFIGHCCVEGQRWRLRAWAQGDTIRVRVKV